MNGHGLRRRRSRRVLAVVAVVAVAAAGAAVGLARRGGDAAPPAPVRRAGTGRAAVTAPRRRTRPRAAFTPLAMPAAPARAAVVVPVLMFHRVAPADTITNATSADLTVTPDRFAAEMARLRRDGYHPVSQTTLFRALVDAGPLPSRPVVLTFDDGYVDDAVAVAPVLRRYGWPATFAIIAGRVGETAFLTWDQIVRLDREGFDIASHSMDHVDLAGAGPAGLHRQLDGSRRLLAGHLGHPVYWFVYPAGSYDAAAEAAARDAGYLLAYTTDPGSSITSATPMAEPRVRVHGADTPADVAAVVGAASAG